MHSVDRSLRFEWGRLPGWSQMPFRWRPKLRRYAATSCVCSDSGPDCGNASDVRPDEGREDGLQFDSISRYASSPQGTGAEKLKAFAMRYGTGEVSPINRAMHLAQTSLSNLFHWPDSYPRAR